MTDPPAGGDARVPEGLDALGALSEPTRRALYEHVVAVGDWVSRDAAADALRIERGTAAHHLERLAGDGLLDVQFRRLSGRSGPGAGRPAKLYRRARREVSVALPPRDYELAGRVLARAVDRARTEHVDVGAALDEVAADEGRRMGALIRSRVASTSGRSVATRRRAVVDVLAEHGFEPQQEQDGTIVLRNCPFHQLARQHTELVCGINLCMLGAAIGDVPEARIEARLEPEPERCCVKLRPC